MIQIAIPAWNAKGVIPPVDRQHPTGNARSPYAVQLAELVLRFGSTPERLAILDGFLRYRGELHKAGLVEGFQWLNGSFLEQIESLEQRSPNDLDVVSFVKYPSGLSQRDLQAGFPYLVPADSHAQQMLKTTYRVDGYLVDLGMDPQRLVERAAYWYGLWSHRRDETWKGYLAVDLTPAQDTAARSEWQQLSLQRL